MVSFCSLIALRWSPPISHQLGHSSGPPASPRRTASRRQRRPAAHAAHSRATVTPAGGPARVARWSRLVPGTSKNGWDVYLYLYSYLKVSSYIFIYDFFLCTVCNIYIYIFMVHPHKKGCFQRCCSLFHGFRGTLWGMFFLYLFWGLFRYVSGYYI